MERSLRDSSILIPPADFKTIGYQLVDALAAFYENIGEKPVTTAESPTVLQTFLPQRPLPAEGSSAASIVSEATKLLMEHSLFNGHPKFFGYITSSPTQIGALADLLAAAVNANVGANILSPMGTAIEKQAIKWLAEFIDLPQSWGGLMVSGGNMANLTGFLAARTAKSSGILKAQGLKGSGEELLFYCSKATHTWIDKAAVLFGHGTDAIRWIPVSDGNRMDIAILEKTILEDQSAGRKPFLVIGNAGDISTGIVDDFESIAAVCKKFELWFHVDGAYGAPAVVVPEFKSLFAGMEKADSIAIDPHKWLYSPLEAGCILVKDPQHLINTYSAHPVYYNFDGGSDEPLLNYYEYGFQNSRGLRALKVWMALQQAGKNGYVKLIREDIQLSQKLSALAEAHPELEAVSQNLSISNIRYIPAGINVTEDSLQFLNELNERLLNELQRGGEIFLSNALVDEKYCLRACIVNYRTSEKDIEEAIELIVRKGREIYGRN